MSKAISTDLNSDEQTRLTELCESVDNAVEQNYAAGEALLEISQSKLYRGTHKTLESFVLERWGFSKGRAYQLIDASKTKARLSTMVDKTPEAEGISSERQLRELKDVPDDQLEEVVEKAAVLASDEGGPIIASIIKKAKKIVMGEAETEKTEPVPELLDPEPITPEGVESIQDDQVVTRARRLIVDRLRGVQLDLGNIGVGGSCDDEIDKIRERAGV